MTALSDTTFNDSLSWLYPPILQENWRSTAHRRLNQALAAALPVTISDESRLVFFSDLHRGDGGSTDLFLPNKALFLRALTHYYAEDYTYVEVGDGDELWMHYDFPAVRQAHGDVFDLLHQFHAGQRLHLLFGNHDMRENGRTPQDKDGIPTRESLLLLHSPSGQKILVCHGHQADLTSERFYTFTRLTNRHFWRHLQEFGVGQLRIGTSQAHSLQNLPRALRAWTYAQPRRIEQRLVEWSGTRQQPLICGHTHLAAWQESGHQPYYNIGSGLQSGVLTGLEICHGMLTAVHWSWDGRQAARRVRRQTPLGLAAC